ncbi:unnamed protein product [Caenorhabditis bovis]|uniref:Uncharacterized protein n=1 Tax=Caenorhabditis bovis TaxID=2654633 RepID=A0A8S1EPV4_9PELO|nr:unnamed protein product [Caenorhabditis bovis]
MESPTSFAIPIPLKDSNASHLKSLRRFSIEVWNLTQNWGDYSSKCAKALEQIVNARLQIMYSKTADEKLSDDEKLRLEAKILKSNDELNSNLDGLEKVIGKCSTAQQRIAAWKQLTATSSSKEEKNIVETLEETIPTIIRMFQRELDAKKCGLRDIAENENRSDLVEINCTEFSSDDELINVLVAENAKLSYWIEAALIYYRHKRYSTFLYVLEKAGTLAGLEYAGVQTDQMRALDILAAYWMDQGYKEKNKEKRYDLFNKATVLFNTADKISMYEWSHLTVRAWFFLYEKEQRENKLLLADQQFNFVIKTQPKNCLSLIGKAVVSYNRKDFKSAVYYFRKAIRMCRHSVADLRVGLGYCFAKLNKPDKAKLAFERALELDENNVSAMCGLAILHLNTLEPELFKSAIQLFGKAYQIHQEHPVVLIHLANHFFFKREYDRVHQLAWHAMQTTESEEIKAEACYQVARLKHVQRQFDTAFQYYYQAKTLNNGELTIAYFGLGQMHIYRNELVQAIEAFEVVHRRMPNNMETVKILGSLYAHTTFTDLNEQAAARQKGRDLLLKYLETIPDDIEVCIDLAQLLESVDAPKSLHLYETAIDLLKTVEDIDPQPEMLNNVGALHMQLNDFEKAKKYFESARDRLLEMIETQERDESERVQLLTIRYNLARCLEHLCRTTEAEQMYREITKECPNYTDCYMRLGCLTRDRGQIYDSSVWFKNALQYDQTSPDAWTLIGNLHMSKNEWQPAQKKFEHILQKCENKTTDAYSLIALGNVWLEQLMTPNHKKEDEKKYMDRALAMYQKALKSQPRNLLAANGIGCVLAFKKAWNDARDVFSQVREATSTFLDVWINIAHVYMEREQYMPAVQMYSSAMKKFNRENDPAILHYLAKAYYRAGMVEEAKETLEKTLLEAQDNILVKFNYAVVMKRSAKNVLRQLKMTSDQVKNAISDLKFSERIFKYISKNDDLSLPGAKLLSRTICGEEAQNCRDLLTQANQKLEVAMAHDEEERKLKQKQEEEKEALRRKMMEEARRKEEEERQKLEAAKALRSTFVEMTKDIMRLPQVVEEKKSRSGRRKKGEDGDEFVNDSSDYGVHYGDGEGGEEGGERRKKDKAARKASRKRRERRESGSDAERRAEKKQRRKEEKERKMAERLSAKQTAKIKSRAFVSSSDDSSDDDKDRKQPEEDDDDDSPPPPIIGASDSDDDDAGAEVSRKKKKKAVVDSDASESDDDENPPVIGKSSDEDDEPGPSKKKASDESEEEEEEEDNDDDDQPSKKKKKKMMSSDESNSDDSDSD